MTTWSNGNAGIASVYPSPALDSASGGIPHIILLHIGTNDCTESTAEEMIGRLGGLMDKIADGAPDALLVVAQIIPLSWGNTVIDPYNAAVPGLVETRAAAGKHIMWIDMNTGWDSGSMMDADNIHPNPTGYRRMADLWYASIEEFLP